MSLFSKQPIGEYDTWRFRKIEMYRKGGTLIIVLGVGRWYSLRREQIFLIRDGQEIEFTFSPLDQMAQVLKMDDDTLLSCLGLSPRSYLQRVFHLSQNQDEAAIDAILDMRDLAASSENKKGTKAA
jgi:hypothetical protein